MTVTVRGAAEVAAALERTGAGAVPAVFAATEATATSLQKTWRANARRTAGKHGRWYPSSITTEKKGARFGSIEFEVGPEIGKRQGAMGPGFENGSRNQPPHLDGKKAADAVGPKYQTAVEAAIAGLL